MKILVLSEKLMEESIDQIIELEMLIYNIKGHLYSEKKWNKENFQMPISKKEKFSFIMKENNRVIGFSIGYLYKEGWAHISRVGIHPKFQGQGLGKVLITRQTDEMIRDDSKIITIETKSINFPAVNLYSSIGYNIMEEKILKAYIKIRNRNINGYINDFDKHIVLERHIHNFDTYSYLKEIASKDNVCKKNNIKNTMEDNNEKNSH